MKNPGIAIPPLVYPSLQTAARSEGVMYPVLVASPVEAGFPRMSLLRGILS